MAPVRARDLAEAGLVMGEELEQLAGCCFRVLGMGVDEYMGAQP